MDNCCKICDLSRICGVPIGDEHIGHGLGVVENGVTNVAECHVTMKKFHLGSLSLSLMACKSCYLSFKS